MYTLIIWAVINGSPAITTQSGLTEAMCEKMSHAAHLIDKPDFIVRKAQCALPMTHAATMRGAAYLNGCEPITLEESQAVYICRK